MDRFDTRLQSAREPYEPTPGFVDKTMNEVKKRKIQRRFSLKIWAPAAAGVFAVLAIVIVFAPKPIHNDVIDSSKNPSGMRKAAATTAPTASPAAISDGTDDASLARDLSSVQSSMTQTGNDQSNADNAVNDNQQEISIPN